jgi:glycine/D-amino acid oxidase-like deaminating enzyme
VARPRGRTLIRFAPPTLSPDGVWWLKEALARSRGTPCPELERSAHADVCVVGGGYTGLWTAIELREQAPDCEVVLVEATECGFGASGRNGGFVTGWFDELDNLVHRFGANEGLRLARRSHWAIERVRDFAAEHGIDCHFRQEGALKAATAPRQLARCEPARRACRAHGCDGMLEEIDPDTLAERTGSPLPVGAVNQVDAAAVQPALLVRGLREAALRLGVSIHERTPMVALAPERPARVLTPRGSVTADRVVLATNVWTARVRELRRSIAVVASHIVATEPVGDRLDGTRFRRGELVADLRSTLHYMQATVDGRIVFGRAGGALGPGGRVPGSMFHDPRFVATVRGDLRRWFPQLGELRIEYSWGGAVDRAPGHLPFVGELGDHDNVLYGLGFSGNGVGPSALIGRILGRRALGIADEDTMSPLATGPRGYLPPEPLRSIGGAAVRWGAARADDAEEAGEEPPILPRTLRTLVAASVPQPLEPRLWRQTRTRRTAWPEGR